MMGTTIDGEEAEHIGLVNRAVEADALEEEVRNWAERFLRIPPLAVGLTKRAVDKSLDMDIVSSMDANAAVQSMLLKTEDFKEAITAKLEKREPKFKGK